MKIKLVEVRDEAKGTKSFFWETEKPVSYLPGQFFYFTLPSLKYPDPRGATRDFTLSSSPSEGNIIRLTTRIRQESGYKRSLNELQIGTEITGEGPNGEFIFDEHEKGSQVFLAGGIGITPFRSMIRYCADKKLNTPIRLIYSNSIPEEIAFRKEFEEIASKNSWFGLSMTITKPEESSETWDGLTGRIDEEMVKKLTSELTDPTFWLCGPPPMVDAISKVLGSLGVGSDRVRSEKFTGY